VPFGKKNVPYSSNEVNQNFNLQFQFLAYADTSSNVGSEKSIDSLTNYKASSETTESTFHANPRTRKLIAASHAALQIQSVALSSNIAHKSSPIDKQSVGCNHVISCSTDSSIRVQNREHATTIVTVPPECSPQTSSHSNVLTSDNAATQIFRTGDVGLLARSAVRDTDELDFELEVEGDDKSCGKTPIRVRVPSIISLLDPSYKPAVPLHDPDFLITEDIDDTAFEMGLKSIAQDRNYLRLSSAELKKETQSQMDLAREQDAKLYATLWNPEEHQKCTFNTSMYQGDRCNDVTPEVFAAIPLKKRKKILKNPYTSLFGAQSK